MFIGKIIDRMDTYLPTSQKKKSKQSRKTPLKLNMWLVDGLMDKAIAKVNQIQNELLI